MKLDVLFEDNHIIAVNKRSGDLVQGDKTGDKPLSDMVKEYIKEKYNKPGDVYLGVTHRIDRPTSGIVIFARTSKALTRLNKMFQDKEINKTYWAVVEKEPPNFSDTLTHFLKRNTKQNKSYASLTKAGKDSKESVLSYEMKGKTNRYFMLEIDPKTGRHHQIRTQLSFIGCIIKGDLKYGAKRSNPDGSIHLHARGIEFLHPVKKEPVLITANPPKDPVWDEFVKLS
ncbi:RluA family pseudouridine synthase [Flavobacteriales bacterium]|nr:RluA family pseudouridine synthase [Flavobacteriales bacterium]